MNILLPGGALLLLALSIATVSGEAVVAKRDVSPVALSPVALSPVAPSPVAASLTAAAPVTTTDHLGKIHNWRIQADGSVFFRLVGSSKTKNAYQIWFTTPPRRSATTHVEEFILAGILDAIENKRSVRVTADSTNDDNGRTPKDAIPLLAIETR